MKLSTIVYKIKCYGFKGILDYLSRYSSIKALKSKLQPNCGNTSKPERGLTLVGPFSTSTSISKVMRDLAIRLKDCNIPFQAIDTCDKATIPESEYTGLLTTPDNFNINRYSHVIQMFVNYVPACQRLRVYSCFFWEFESGLEHLYPDMTGDALLAMSDFDEAVFHIQKPNNIKSVRKILYPLRELPRFNANRENLRIRLNIPLNAFVVYFNFDFMSSYFRKNPEAVIKAFAKAFSEKNNAILLFKTMRANRNPSLHDRMMQVIERYNLGNRFVEIKEFLSQEDLIGLTNVCDAYISLHRGEGFGLTLAEAMQLAKPVICTDYSSTTEFCKPGTAIPIPYRLVPVRPEQIDTPEYKYVKEWAEPDIDEAAKALKKLYDNTELRHQIGEAGKRSIEEIYSNKNFKASIMEFLSDSQQAGT